MADELREPEHTELDETEGYDEDEGPPSTPFDHPAFLPVLLIGFAIWFGYDGWFNEDMEWVKFNRYGFGFVLGAAVYATIQAFREPPYLMPALLLGYTLWLGYLGWVGPAGSWYNDTDASLLFNRYGCGAAALLTAVSAIRARLRVQAAGSGGQ